MPVLEVVGKCLEYNCSQALAVTIGCPNFSMFS